MQQELMKIKHAAAMLASLCLVPLGAAAAGAVTPGGYVGGGYVMGTLDDNDVPDDADLDALFIRGGYQLNENLAIEGRLGTGVRDDKIGPVKVELEDVLGAYFKVGLPTDIGLYPYVIAGATHAKVKARCCGVSDSSTETDLSYGIGADYWFTPKISGGVEYMKYVDKDGSELSGISLGANYKF